MDFWQKAQRVDVRILYALILLAMLIPMVRPLGLPVSVTENTQKVYNVVNSLPPNSVIWVSHDTGPGNAPELNPMLAALARQAFAKNHKLVCTAMFSSDVAPQFIMDHIGPVAAEMGKEYGVDWINLGFKVAPVQAIRLMVDNVHEGAVGVDWSGEPLEKFPLMQRVKAIKDDVNLLFVTTVGSPGYHDWMTYVSEPLKIPLTGGASLTMYSGIQQYIRSGQLQGFLGGLRGAAEYERLVGYPGRGLAGMDAQSIGHLTVIIFIVLGNLGFFLSRKAQGRS